MTELTPYRPAPRFFQLGGEYADQVEPARFGNLVLRHRHDRAATEIGLEHLSDEAFVRHFGRFEPLEGQPAPVAMRYHGHQFRHYNPDLGDGRGFLLAQMLDGRGRLMDLGTKGSGTTPWSRSGDGRLTLKGGVREVLAAAMLETLGVKTSRALSLIETDEELERHDEPSPTRAAVLVRLSHSHIRFGTFQRAAYFRRTDQIEALTAHVVRHYHPHLAEDDPVGLLGAVVEASARLSAQWVAAGFVHGVLNTDNLNVTGESFDYGPWRFLPHYEPGFTAAYFDQTGLYAFARQPEAVFWALTQLGGALRLVADAEPLTEALNRFGGLYIEALRVAIARRFGVRASGGPQDQALVDSALRLLREGGPALRFEPLFFDWFAGVSSTRRALSSPRAPLYAGEAFEALRTALFALEPERPERLEHAVFNRPEPEEMLIDEVEALWDAIAARDDWSAFHAKLAALEDARKAYGFAVPD
ncbi:MAG: protein adenylyltransferase SelO family protein [Brevundimonas sp.]|jgi:serine/tyrosine/threonine adenylyltransferase|uniref:protein adenylyltransferase SelO family protein n=1 Tax=Brevundimonas sp. TaxID=1871086 RepID=UPI00391BAABA